MNFLGHAFLSFNQPEILVGNMIGDFVKGKEAIKKFPEAIQKGIILHRNIDTFTDSHPAIKRSQIFFREDYRLYSGAFVDGMMDHFLANDPKYFKNEVELFDFTQKVYQTVNQYRELLPEPFLKVIDYMSQDNWLYHYRTLKGTNKLFDGIVRRAKYLEINADSAFNSLVINYYTLNQFYYEFIDEVIQYVKNRNE
ncbi:MAG TPA: ACP phosphodiesterase [Edaphocola sp.]|nr:ACP phosphodiesterase [Edaphocola sp.]